MHLLECSLRGVLRGMLIAYRIAISPLIGPTCRFEPSCSHYASEAIERYGALRGVWMSAKRISRCHPLGGHGYDPVPLVKLSEFEAKH